MGISDNQINAQKKETFIYPFPKKTRISCVSRSKIQAVAYLKASNTIFLIDSTKLTVHTPDTLKVLA
jgi:hypothetical protein